MKDKFIERRIITGLIVSTEYLQRVRKFWNPKLLGSSTAKRVAGWCIQYFDKYGTAPKIEIESIFRKHSKGLKPDDVADIEDILADLSDEYERQDKFNVTYLFDQTAEYFDERSLTEFAEGLLGQIENGELGAAKTTATSYSSPIVQNEKNLDLSKPEVSEAIERAFNTSSTPVVSFPRALGTFWNDQMTRGSFIAFMGPEKRGKTFLMLDIAIRAAKQHANVAFFQAGDMSEDQQLKRIAINLTKRSDNPKYIGEMYEPVRDCRYNQMNTCTLKEREGNDGVFEGEGDDFFKDSLTLQHLKEAYKEFPKHRTCYNCAKYWTNHLGTPWVKKVNVKFPLTPGLAKDAVNSLFVKKKLGFRLSTHANGSLTVSIIENILNQWEREDGFVADLIVVDYADILASEIRSEFRHQENDKWMKLRGLSQKKHALLITATQTDADSYDQDTLSLSNYSEDKRKFAHVTAMFGLNQDKKGREKAIGILRINEIVLREGEFSKLNQVKVLQNLKRGQAILSSY